MGTKIKRNNNDQEKFLQRANKTHHNKYDYKFANYINNNTKVCIVCPKHGKFWQIPRSHTSKIKSGCPECSNCSPGTLKKFLKKAAAVHKNKYDYSGVIYKI
jgi:hypothetical protein